jgi:hypothetical protein
MLTGRLNLRGIANAVIGFTALLACGMAAADPPARVARLANIDGAVSFAPAGEDEWVYATPNRPLITGDRVWADAGARAELQIGSLAVRLGSQTSVTILNLDDRVAQFQLAQGALNVRVRRLDPGQTIEIDTPLLAFSVRRPGDYRIDVDPTSAATTVAVRSGEGEVYGEGAAYVISARQWYRFADSSLRDYLYDALPPPDAFDNWALDRDRREDNPVAARYVSPDVIGYSDLDDYGTWSVVEGYGNVWVPTSVASDWAPYHHGHWTWIEPWGWTWVDDAPWGFAPFHYGRWAYARQRWCWVPGPVRARPVYAPALVAFVGGNNFQISVGTGGPSRGVAWFPLAPGEVYRPAYRVSRNYFTNVNVSNTNVSNTYVTNVYNRPDAPNTVYRNREQRGGITAVPATAFVQSRPVAQSAVAVSREVAAAAPVTPVAAIAPVRASVIGGGAATGARAGGAPAAGPGTVSRPPTATIQRPVFARVAPPPPPAPFSAREAALAKDPGRPVDPATIVAARPAATAAPAAPSVKVVAPAAPGTPPPAPTISRHRTNAPPTAAGGAPPPPAGTPPNAPASGVAPGAGQRPRVALPLPPPGAPPVSRDTGGPVPKADISPPPSPPSAVRAPPPAPPVQPAQQPPKAMEARPVPQPPPSAAQPSVAPTPAPAELRREPPPKPPVTPPPVELRREPPPPPVVAKPPPAPVPPPAEQRREAPPPPAPAVAKPPPAPVPPAELRREPPPPPAVVRPPPAPALPPAELRREPPPPPVVAKPPVVPTAPAAVPAAPARQAEPKAKEPAKGEAPKGKGEEKREDQK